MTAEDARPPIDLSSLSPEQLAMLKEATALVTKALGRDALDPMPMIDGKTG
jgi:hypothetical protein